jgi:hypothetical protein
LQPCNALARVSRCEVPAHGGAPRFTKALEGSKHTKALALVLEQVLGALRASEPFVKRNAPPCIFPKR